MILIIGLLTGNFVEQGEGRDEDRDMDEMEKEERRGEEVIDANDNNRRTH